MATSKREVIDDIVEVVVVVIVVVVVVVVVVVELVQGLLGFGLKLTGELCSLTELTLMVSLQSQQRTQLQWWSRSLVRVTSTPIFL